MATTQIRGETQVMEKSLDLTRLFEPFLTPAGGDWDITNSNNDATITGLKDPSNAQDVATKAYVDSLINGLAWSEPARVCAPINIDIAAEMEASDLIDGVTLVAGDRVLLSSQTVPAQNGVYIVQASGAGVRALDWDTGDAVASHALFVSEGTTCGDKAYVVTNNGGSDVVGTDGLTFVQFAGAGQIPPTHVYNDIVAGTNGSPTVTLSNTLLLSGTERIYLNGVRQASGGGNDYTIVSATGVITFNFNLKNTPGQQDIVIADYDQL